MIGAPTPPLQESEDSLSSSLHSQDVMWYQYQACAGHVHGGMNDLHVQLWNLGISGQVAIYFDL